MLTELFKRLALREKEQKASFWSMARRLAAGEKVAMAGIEKMLADSGKTLADLKVAVELIQQRRQWAAVVNGVAGLEQERAALRQRVAHEDRKLEAAERAHTEATLPLHARLEQIQGELREADHARQRLTETCPDADLTAELASVVQRIGKLRTRAYELRRTAGECEAAAKSDLTQSNYANETRAGYWREKAEDHRRRAAASRGELVGVEAELAELESRETELRAQLLVP